MKGERKNNVKIELSDHYQSKYYSFCRCIRFYKLKVFNAYALKYQKSKSKWKLLLTTMDLLYEVEKRISTIRCMDAKGNENDNNIFKRKFLFFMFFFCDK